MRRSHQRTRSSIDRTLEDLLADLDDGQLESLLQEANSTGDTHVAVAQAITMFERPLPPSMSPRASMIAARPPQGPRKFLTSLSPRKGSLRRRSSNRSTTGPEPRTPKRSSFVLTRNTDVEASLDNVLARVSIDSRRPMSPLRPMSANKPMTPKSPNRNSYIVSSKRASVRLDYDMGFGDENLMPPEPNSPRSIKSAKRNSYIMPSKRASVRLDLDLGLSLEESLLSSGPRTPKSAKSAKRNSYIITKNTAPLLPDFDFGFDVESSIDIATVGIDDHTTAAQRATTRPISPRPTSPRATPARTTNNSTKMSRAYKRISRPTAFFADSLNGSMDGTSSNGPQIHDLLAAYFSAKPLTSSTSSSSSTTNGSSPITPRSCSAPFAASPLVVSWDQAEAEGPDSPWEDLFEPTPGRIRVTSAPGLGKAQKSSFGSGLGLGFGGMNPMREPSRNISGIFEVLGPIETPVTH